MALISGRGFMETQIVVRQVGADAFERVGQLTYELLAELYPDLGYKRNVCVDTARTLLAGDDGVWSFLATTRNGRDVGVVMLNECAAIYAGGRFGEISELYVVPESRSKKVGALLTEAVVAFGRKRKWPFIEVGAPSVPAWQRTVDFYLRHGFEEVGPRLYLTLDRPK
jgi:GNAT superfamily N-acetyltransferase